MSDKKIIKAALQLACEAQNVNRIATGHRVLKALIGTKLGQSDKINIQNIEEVAFRYIDFDDEWEYRRYLELIEFLDLSELYPAAIKRGSQSTNDEVNETSEEWKSVLTSDINARAKAKTVLIYLDDQPLHVSKVIDSHWVVRGQLGIARGNGVAYANKPTEALSFLKGHSFNEGEKYVTVDGSGLFDNFPNGV